MQAQNMLASQRCAVQPRATLRTAQFGSCNALRGVRLTMRFIGGGELSVGVLSRHASLKLFNRRMPTEYVDLQRSYIFVPFLIFTGIPRPCSSSPCGTPSDGHASGSSSSNSRADSGRSYHEIPAWIPT